MGTMLVSRELFIQDADRRDLRSALLLVDFQQKFKRRDSG